jgi:hypothetical protein
MVAMVVVVVIIIVVDDFMVHGNVGHHDINEFDTSSW